MELLSSPEVSHSHGNHMAYAVRRRWATGTMILLHSHRPSVEAMIEHREPSHPMSAAGANATGGESPMRNQMQVLGEEYPRKPSRRGPQAREWTINTGKSKDKFPLKTKTMWRGRA